MKSLFQFHVHFREITSDLGRVHITFIRYCLICDTLLHLFIGYAWWGWWLMFQTHIALDDCKICIIMQGKRGGHALQGECHAGILQYTGG